MLTIRKARILRKKPLEKRYFGLKKWVKSVQTAGYNGAGTVYQVHTSKYSDLLLERVWFLSMGKW